MTAINFPANPSNGDTHQGFVYNSTLGVWQSAGSQTAVTSFTGLSDTPSTLGTAGQIAKVNSGGTALEFADQSGVTVYATADQLPGSGNAGDMAYVSATNRLYLWTGTGWYNIALINTNPTISGVSSSYTLASDGTATVITVTATDPEGIPITYSIASDTSGNIATVTQGTGSNTNVFTITPSTNTANAGTFSLTFRASDGVNIASSIASFTLQFSVTNQNYTTALITSTGSNGATNGTFVDSSSANKTVTNLNASQTSFSPYRHGGYSTYFDGSGDNLTAPSSADFNFGTGDVTVEGWINQSLSVGSQYGIFGNFDTSGNGTYAFWYNGTVGTGAEFRVATDNVANMIGFRADTPVNEWFHFAYVRSSGAWKFYLNGIEVTTRNTDVGDTDGASFGTIAPTIGSFTNGIYMQGYFTDLRVVKGTAVYTSAFTPPTERLTAITNTSLLTCHLPYIADGSTNGHSITVNGNTKTEPFAPYDTQEYTVGDHGGSYAMVSRSGQTGPSIDVASHADFAFGTSPFTIEFWYYPNQAGQQWDQLISTTGNNGIFFANRSGYLDWTNNNDTAALIRSSWPAIGQWSHIVLTQDSTTRAVFINGVRTGTASTAHSWAQGQFRVAYGAGRGNFSNIRIVKGTAVYDPSQSTLTVPTAPLTDVTNTKLLLKGENGGIIDKAQVAKEIRLISVTSSTTQYKYLPSSIYFNGAGKYIDLVNTPLYNFGTGDFTVEAWIYNNGGGTGTFLTGTTSGDIDIAFDSSGLRLGRYNTAWDATQAYTFTSAWTHYACVRSSGAVKFFINGTQQGSDVSNSINYTITGIPRIGIAGNGSDRPTTAYISDLRITKGLARYTTTFTPPAAALEG